MRAAKSSLVRLVKKPPLAHYISNPQTFSDMTLKPDSLRSYLVATYRRHEADGLAHQNQPSVTVSRDTGAGGEELCQHLGKMLTQHYGASQHPWTVIDRNLIDFVLQEMNQPAKVAEYLPEASHFGIEQFIREMLGVHPPVWSMVEKTNEVIRRLAKAGNVVIVGRGSHLVTRDLARTFSIRLIAPLEARIIRIMQRDKVQKDDAVALIKKEDEAKAAYLDTYFQRDIDNPRDYNLVLNTSGFTPEQGAKVVFHALIEFLANGH